MFRNGAADDSAPGQHNGYEGGVGRGHLGIDPILGHALNDATHPAEAHSAEGEDRGGRQILKTGSWEQKKFDREAVDGVRKPKLKRSVSSRFFNVDSKLYVFVKLPLLEDLDREDVPSVFAKKMEICNVSFDFLAPSYPSEKEMKRETLVETQSYLSARTYGLLGLASCARLMEMIEKNIFRPPPPPPGPERPLFDQDDDPVLEASWIHLELVYSVLLRFIEVSKLDVTNAKKFFTRSFIMQILALFDTGDPRERDYLKAVLHSLYGSFLTHRAFIRKSIRHIFLGYSFENERLNGIGELLEILESIINGFALPLKAEHIVFLRKVLLPLHKPTSLYVYHQQLSGCIIRFVEKDPKLGPSVITEFLKYWPISNTSKEFLFISELEEILVVMDFTTFRQVIPVVFKRIAKGLRSDNFQVADRFLALWNNDFLVNLFSTEKDAVLPLVISSLVRNVRFHWNRNIRSLSMDVLRFFAQLDPVLFEECTKRLLKEEEELGSAKKKRLERWEAIENLARERARVEHTENLIKKIRDPPELCARKLTPADVMSSIAKVNTELLLDDLGEHPS